MSHKKQFPSESTIEQKWQSLQASIAAAEALIVDETVQFAGEEKSPRLLAVQKKLAQSRQLLAEISDGLPEIQRLARLASFPEDNIYPVLEIGLNGVVEYINPAAQKAFPDLQAKGTAHPFLANWPEVVDRICQEPGFYLDREVQVEGFYYLQSIVYIEEHHCIRLYGREISRAKKTELALQQSELRFRTLIDQAPVAIALSRDSKFLYVNKAYLKLHGLANQAELLGHPVYERVAQESQAESRERAERGAHGLAVEMPYEYTALHTDGSLVPVIAAVTQVTLVDGPATAEFFQDISELKRMQVEREQLLVQVQLERDRMHSLLESMNDEVWFCDQDGKILLANQAAVQNIGYNSLDELSTTVSALIGDLEIYNSDGSPRFPDDAALTRTIKEEVPVFGEDIVRNRRTGELKYREFNTALIRSEAGKLLGAVAVVRDISQRKRAEQALQQNQALLDAIMNGTPDPVFLKDQHSRILLANPATLAVIGKPAEQIIGKTDAEFYDDPAVGYAIMENDRRVMETGQTEVVEEKVSTPGNERVFLSTKAPYRDALGNIIGVIGISRDITERKKREEDLRRLSRTLRAISNSNQALMHAESETQFMEQVCEIIVKDCGYKMVWIGFARQDQAKSVQPVASAGFDQTYLDSLNITWADTERGQGPTGTAIRTGQPSLCRNMRTDPRFKIWFDEAIKRGYASSLVLPLLSGDGAFGALTIYSEVIDPFTNEEIKLLSELAYDLAYGITTLRLRHANLIAEEALKASEEKYRRLIENVNDLVCEIDSQAKYLFVNSQYEQILGYTSQELIGSYTRELIHPDDVQVSTPTFRKLVDGKSISHNEWRFKHKNGEWRWFDCVGQTYEKSPGDTRVVVISRDITERKKMEEALKVSEEHYRSLFEGMTEGFALHEIVCDEDGRPCDYRFLELNPAFERLTGLKKENVIGKLHNTILPDDDPDWVQIYGKVALTGQPVHFENYSSGLKAHYEVFSYCPAPGQFAVLFMNITERKNMEKALQESRQKNQDILESIQDGFMELDRSWCFTYLNRRAAQNLGFEPEELVGKNVWEIFPSILGTVQETFYRQVMDQRQAAQLELEGTLAHKWYEFQAYPSSAGITIFWTEITERKLAEEKLSYQAALLANISDVVYATDLQLHITAWNQAAEKLYGWRAADVLGKPVVEVVQSKFDPELRKKLTQEMVEKGSVAVEIEHQSKSGQIYFFESQTLMLQDSAGKISGYVSVNHDITERKQAEEKLRQSEERYRRLFENLQETLVVQEVVFDDAGQPIDLRYVDINPAAERILGIARNEIVGKTRRQLAGQPDKEGVEMAAGVLSTGLPSHLIRHTPGYNGWFESSTYALESGIVATLATDITERKQAEEKLRQSESLYRAIGETIDYGVWVCAPDGRNTYASESFLKLVGLTQQQCSDFGWGDVLHPDDTERTIAAWKECVRSGGTWDIEHRYRGVDGQWHPILARGVPIRDENGQITSWAGINLDISKQKQVEEALQEHARMLDLAHVLVRDMDNKVIFWNRGAEELYGWSKDEALGKETHQLFQTVFPHSREALDDNLLKYGVWEGELIHTKRDGSKLVVASHHVLHRDQDNRPVAIIETNNDVTALKQAEEALQKAHDDLEERVQERTEQLQAINEELNAEIVERKEAEEIIRLNATRAENLADISGRLAAAGLSQQKIYEIISRSIAELIGDTCVVRLLSDDGQELDLVSFYHKDPAVRAHLSNMMNDLPIKVGQGISGKVISTGRSFFLPSTAPHKLKRMVEPQEAPVVEGLQIYSLMCVPLGQEGQILGTIAVMGSPQRRPYTQDDLLFLEDLADRAGLSLAKARLYHKLENALEREKQTRVQLIQSEKNSALARMVASVAHEINNPIQTIKNCMYLLKTTIDQSSPDGEILSMAASEANRIGDLVSRLRDLYRPSKDPALKTINILDVLFEVNALLEPHLQHNKVKLDIETCTDTVAVTANADQIKQVFLNISLNAIDAMQPGGGRLTARVSCPTALQTCIAFTDTGKGIASEEMQHIFEPLYTTKEKGTGLGLVISHEIVKNHNGYITVESQLGQGATFSIWLPIAQTAEPDNI